MVLKSQGHGGMATPTLTLAAGENAATELCSSAVRAVGSGEVVGWGVLLVLGIESQNNDGAERSVHSLTMFFWPTR